MSRLSPILATIRAICQSPSVKYYRIGFTSKSAGAKRSDYKPPKRQLVVLADKMTRARALWLEQALQEATCGMGGKKCDRSSILYTKYDPKRLLEGRYFRSHGGGKSDPDARVHSVYMVWKVARAR